MHGPLVEVDGQWILRLMVEVKVVPSSVVKRKLQEQVDQIRGHNGSQARQKERRTLADDIRLGLLPLAFSKQYAAVQVWVDPKSGLLITDAGSTAKADQVMTSLVQAIDGLVVRLLHTQSPRPRQPWRIGLSSREAPLGFSVERECELKATDESKGRGALCPARTRYR